MKSVEKSGRTVDEAVNLALAELGVGIDQVKVEVLEEAKGGFLGLIGSKLAVVQVSVKETKAEWAGRFLTDICRAMGVDSQINVRTDPDHVYADITGPEAGMLIGHHGQTLDALQFLLNLASNRDYDDGLRVLVDVEGYRKRREETLERLATRLADRVRRSGEQAVLEPMSAQERRVIHVALQDHPDVTTSSEGEEPNRRVVILPKR